MLERLGNVIYWLGCALSAVVAIFTGYAFIMMAFYEQKWREMWVLVLFGGIAVIIWVAGRAVRYILVGR